MNKKFIKVDPNLSWFVVLLHDKELKKGQAQKYAFQAKDLDNALEKVKKHFVDQWYGCNIVRKTGNMYPDRPDFCCEAVREYYDFIKAHPEAVQAEMEKEKRKAMMY